MCIHTFVIKRKARRGYFVSHVIEGTFCYNNQVIHVGATCSSTLSGSLSGKIRHSVENITRRPTQAIHVVGIAILSR